MHFLPFISGFIDDTDTGVEIRHNDVGRRSIPHSCSNEDDDYMQEILRRIENRCKEASDFDYDEEVTEVEQQALLPSVKDPKLWMVKCAVG